EKSAPDQAQRDDADFSIITLGVGSQTHFGRDYTTPLSASQSLDMPRFSTWLPKRAPAPPYPARLALPFPAHQARLQTAAGKQGGKSHADRESRRGHP